MNEHRAKKILVTGLSDTLGGIEYFIYNTTVFSDQDKYKYEYLIHGQEQCRFQKQISEFYGQDSNVIHFVRGLKRHPIGWLKDMISFYRKNGKKYDYVHMQTIDGAAVIYLFPFCLFYKMKVISHSHCGETGNRSVINAVFRSLLNKISTKKLACSYAAADWLFGRKTDEAIIINNGIDTNRFRYNEETRMKIRRQYGINDEFVIGHVGRFCEQKNHEKIIDIFQEIVKTVPKAKLILVGTGGGFDQIKHIVEKQKLSQNVIFAGRQSETEAYYSAFDAFLMPSLYEGLPIAGVEAQASGLPCLFSDKIDKQILITDNAKMIPLSASSSTWAKHILEIMNENKNRYSYSEIVDEKGYSIRATVKKLESVYEV